MKLGQTLNTREAMKYTQMPRRKLQVLARDGTLTNFGSTNRIRYSRAQLDKFLEQGSVK
jgi:hypothetical protein